MSDIIQKIDWAVNTIRDQETFGLDDLNASLSSERGAKGVLLSCKSEIERLEKENAELKKAYARNIEAMTGHISNDLLIEIKKYPTALPYICELRKEIDRLEAELKKKDQTIEKAEKTLKTVIDSAMSFMTLGDRHSEEGQKIIEARQYFKQKDEVKE